MVRKVVLFVLFISIFLTSLLPVYAEGEDTMVKYKIYVTEHRISISSLEGTLEVSTCSAVLNDGSDREAEITDGIAVLEYPEDTTSLVISTALSDGSEHSLTVNIDKLPDIEVEAVSPVLAKVIYCNIPTTTRCVVFNGRNYVPLDLKDSGFSETMIYDKQHPFVELSFNASISAIYTPKEKEPTGLMPTFAFFKKYNGMKTDSDRIVIEGAAYNCNLLTINGRVITIGDLGAFSEEVELQYGENVIKIYGENSMNTKEITLCITKVSPDEIASQETGTTEAPKASITAIIVLVFAGISVAAIAIWYVKKQKERS